MRALLATIPLSLLVIGSSSIAAIQSVNCFAKLAHGRSVGPISFRFNSKNAEVQLGEGKCALTRDSNYENKWLNFQTSKDYCPAVGRALFGVLHYGNYRPVRIYEFAVSPEVRKGAKGVIQIGFEHETTYDNDWAPCVNHTARLIVECTPR